MARSGVRLGHFELDLSIPALSGPVARPLDEELPHPRSASLRPDPDVVDESLRLGRHEAAFAEDQVAEEFVVRGFGNPPLRSISCHIRFNLLPEVDFPLAAAPVRARWFPFFGAALASFPPWPSARGGCTRAPPPGLLFGTSPPRRGSPRAGRPSRRSNGIARPATPPRPKRFGSCAFFG